MGSITTLDWGAQAVESWQIMAKRRPIALAAAAADFN
jgi:hypothetical protein